MLDGRLPAREWGLNAGLTSSPDFFRTIGGLREPVLSLSSLEDSPSRGESRPVCVTGCECAGVTSKTIFESVLDLECVIFLCELDRGGRESSAGEEPSEAALWPSTWGGSCVRIGEPDFRSPLRPLIAAWSSARFSFSSSLLRPLISSSSLVWVDSGGEMVIP